MAHLICGVILIIVTLVVQNTLGELEQYLISNSETGGRKTWAEISEDPPRRQKRNAGYIFGVTNEEIQDIVITHNFLRNVSNPTAANMQQMRWSPLIAENAQNYTCGCNSYHSPRDDRYIDGLGRVGENIWVGTHHHGVAGEVWSWFNEEPFYDYWTLVCSNPPCGHYTQAAWYNSYLVGCGFAQCDEAIGFFPGKRAFLFICQYYYVGNYQGTRPYQNGTACSNCPTGWQGGCVDGLCTPDAECGNDTCQNGGVFIDDGSCVCNCTSGYEGAYCEATPREVICPPRPDPAVETTAAPTTNGTADDVTNWSVIVTSPTTDDKGDKGNCTVCSLCAILLGIFIAICCFDC